LHQQPGWLLFEAVNPLPPVPATPAELGLTGSPSETGGFGLRNLRERLRLLYGTRFELSAGPVGPEFVTRLLIPI
jgi:sensor histidine kinase YesM